MLKNEIKIHMILEKKHIYISKSYFKKIEKKKIKFNSLYCYWPRLIVFRAFAF